MSTPFGLLYHITFEISIELINIKTFERQEFPIKTKRNLLIAAILLFILSILDSIITDYGIKNMLIEEANPIMKLIHEKSVLSFYFVKIILPSLLIFILLKLKPTKTLKIFMGIALIIYVIVFLIHILWLFLAFVYM